MVKTEYNQTVSCCAGSVSGDSRVSHEGGRVRSYLGKISPVAYPPTRTSPSMSPKFFRVPSQQSTSQHSMASRPTSTSADTPQLGFCENESAPAIPHSKYTRHSPDKTPAQHDPLGCHSVFAIGQAKQARRTSPTRRHHMHTKYATKVGILLGMAIMHVKKTALAVLA